MAWSTVVANVIAQLKAAMGPRLRVSAFRFEPPVQGRNNLNQFHRALSHSSQGIAERPLPCSYNVIQSVSALSRRWTGNSASERILRFLVGEARYLSMLFPSTDAFIAFELRRSKN